MTVERPGEKVTAVISQQADDMIILEYDAPDARTTLHINLSSNAANILELESTLRNGKVQILEK